MIRYPLRKSFFIVQSSIFRKGDLINLILPNYFVKYACKMAKIIKQVEQQQVKFFRKFYYFSQL